MSWSGFKHRGLDIRLWTYTRDTFGSEFLNYELAISTRRAGHKKHLVVLESRNKKCPRRH